MARALSKKGHEILLLEQASSIGMGISSRNSEVIHAGIYYDKEIMPLKSRFCVEGKQLLYEYCRERDIPHRRCGKLLVATDEQQRDVGLPKLVEYAKGNGVHDLRIVTRDEISDPYSDVYEPNVTCTGGVYSPSTGIVDSHALMSSLLAEAEENGTTLALHCRVQGGRLVPPNSEEEGNVVLQLDDESEIACDNVIVCAGLATDEIASSILTKGNGSTGPSVPKQYYAKGNYFKLENQKSPFTRLIYPLPDPKGGLGVHATIDLTRSTRFGPDVEWLATDTTLEGIDMNVDPARAESFYAAVRKYWPSLGDGNLVPDYAGVRPKRMHPSVEGNNNQLLDFMVSRPAKGLTVLLGIESPGLTSSLAIGNYVAGLIK